MQAWHEESAFADYIRAQKFTSRARRPLDPNGLTGVFPSSELQTPSPNAQSYLSSSWLSTPSPTLRSLSASPNPSGPFNSTLDTECSPLQRKETFNICRSIYEARKHIDPNGELYRQLGEILLFVQNLESVFSNETIEERFDTLQPLRAWLFWIPVSLCEGECIGSDSSLAKLTVLSHLYAMALAIEPSSPGVCGSDLIKRCSSRLEEVDLEITNNFLRSNGSLVHPKTSPRVMACFCCRDEFTVLQSLEESSGSTCNEFCDFRNCQ
ncbi:hypothetical protein MMC12_003672 [Toensbergia leucococca]|nr:hypothetical protein [Toensbergia leucococca]